MNIYITVFICALVTAVVLGLCAGAVKGFTDVKFWGGEVALAALFTSFINAALLNLTVSACLIVFELL